MAKKAFKMFEKSKADMASDKKRPMAEGSKGEVARDRTMMKGKKMPFMKKGGMAKKGAC